MKIQYVSDLHLDVSNLKLEFDNPDVLVIAGDVSASPLFTADWLEQNVPENLPVIYVAGNHEYDYRDIATHDYSIMSALTKLPNVHFLNNSSKVIKGVKFIGSTLWTGFNAFPEMGLVSKLKDIAQNSISDFKIIYNEDRPFSPEDASIIYKNSRAYIHGELNKPFEGKKVVVTHFPPTRKSIHKMYRGNILNPYFVAEAEDLVIKSDLWIHGHMHGSVNEHIMGVKVLCNPRGYSKVYNLSENPAWNPKKAIKI